MNKNVRRVIGLKFNIPDDLAKKAERLQTLLGFTQGNEITVSAVMGEKNGVTLQNGNAVIYYTKLHMFFRELSVLLENARRADAFEIFEQAYFETLSVMLDVSRCGVPQKSTVFRLIDTMAVMGYNMIMLYTEDVFYIEGRPYFGYLRGRYSPEELRAVDDYANDYGIEAIPCIECYGHMGKYLKWAEAAPIKDAPTVLLAREEKTFAFVEQMIDSITACFRSKRIHIGMDEAYNMGRGKFMDKHGYVPPSRIFAEYMERLIEICSKRGLRPMMWTDMYYRSSGVSYGSNIANCTLSDEVMRGIPHEVDLVYWHYGERGLGRDEAMLCSHKRIGNNVIYAGGCWSWLGHFPEHNYTMDTLREGLAACRSQNVREAMLTVWKNSNASVDWFADLFSFSFFAELAFDQNASEEKLDSRFTATTGGDRRAFYEMSYYFDDFADPARYAERFTKRFMGEAMFWQDILEGMFDSHLFSHPLSTHYATYAKKMQGYACECSADPWRYLYDFAATVFDCLAEKTFIAERLQPAYQAEDKALLRTLADTHLPALKEKVQAVHTMHRKIWMSHNKDSGWSNMDARYAAIAARCDSACELLHAYLTGERPEIESLAEVRLEKPLGGFWSYRDLAAVTNDNE